MTRGTGALWGRRVASRWRSGAAPPAALCCHVRPEPARAAVGPRSHEPNFAVLGGGSHVACACVEGKMIIFFIL
jgi:hypothetical protein